MRIHYAIILALIAASGVAIGYAAQNDHPEGADLNQDGAVNSLDLAFVACQFGQLKEGGAWPSPNPCPLSPTGTSSTTPTLPVPTLTFTATPTPTGTASPSPTLTTTPPATATSVPSSYSVDDLLFDSVGPHDDGTLCGSPPSPPNVGGFDWQFNGRVNGATSGHAQLAGWGTAQWRQCGVSQPNTVIEYRNLRLYSYTGAWNLYPDQNSVFNWCGVFYPDTTTFAEGGCVGSGAGYVMPTGQRTFHWGENTTTKHAGAQCHVLLYEARKIGAGEVMLNTGMDWRSGSSSVGDSWLGSYRTVFTDWRTFGGTSCPASILNANPPPGVSP